MSSTLAAAQGLPAEAPTTSPEPAAPQEVTPVAPPPPAQPASPEPIAPPGTPPETAAPTEPSAPTMPAVIPLQPITPPAPAPVPAPAVPPVPTAQQSAPAVPSTTPPAPQTGPADPVSASPPQPATEVSTSVEPAATPEVPVGGPAWGILNRRFNTLNGATGGVRIVDPSMGVAGSVRTQLVIDSYSGTDFLNEGDRVEQNGQSISLGWSPTDYLELYAALLNRGTATNTGGRSLHILGDVLLGVEVAAALTQVLRVGGGLRFGVMNAVGASETVLDATGIGARATMALDMTRADVWAPFIARLNLDYYFDNSGSIIEDLEEQKLDALENPGGAEETRHLVDRFDRFALGVNRADIFTVGVGFEFPLQLGEETFLYPIAEWRLGLPINRQDYNCPFFSNDEDRGTPEGNDDTCMDDAGFESFPMSATIGTRLAFPVRGLSALLAIDLGITGTSKFVRELVPTAPWRVIFGLGYDYDARPAVVPTPEELPPEPASAPIMGRVDGTTKSPASDMR